jgi:hypothetical protein
VAYTDYGWITDRLAVGGIVEGEGELPFDAVLSMATDAPATLRWLIAAGTQEYRWHCIHDGVSGEENDEIVRRFNAAAEQIHRWLSEGKRVLVHCHAGISRAATTATWYLVRYEGLSWDQALQRVRAGRPQANPTIHFEIPLRLAAGEDLTEEDVERLVDEHIRYTRETQGFELDRQEILNGLRSQGTLPLRSVAVR